MSLNRLARLPDLTLLLGTGALLPGAVREIDNRRLCMAAASHGLAQPNEVPIPLLL